MKEESALRVYVGPSIVDIDLYLYKRRQGERRHAADKITVRRRILMELLIAHVTRC